MKYSLAFSSNVKHTPIIWPSHPTPRPMNTYIQISTVALFIIGQNWKQSTCFSTAEENVVHHTMQYYLIIKYQSTE